MPVKVINKTIHQLIRLIGSLSVFISNFYTNRLFIVFTVINRSNISLKSFTKKHILTSVMFLYTKILLFRNKSLSVLIICRETGFLVYVSGSEQGVLDPGLMFILFVSLFNVFG